jgi:uncharacterized protein (TIGR02147 family)
MELMKICSIYEFNDYKRFIQAWMKNQPQKGRGFFTRVSEKLGISNAAVSQIFSDDRHLNMEQAIEFCELLKIDENEEYYFLLLVECARAGSVKLQKKLMIKIKEEQHKQQQLVNKLPKDLVLSDQVKSVYYSSWVYTGLRNYIATNSLKSYEELSKKLGISESRLNKTIQFLLEYHLLIQEGSKLKIGPQKTHLDSQSPWVIQHHKNWRIKAIDAMQEFDEKNLFYTAPMSLSLEVAQKIRQQLPEFIKQIIDEVGPSESEVVRCLNIDWFEY